MARRDDIWYRLGYALERSRDRLRGGPGAVPSMASDDEAPSTRRRPSSPGGPLRSWGVRRAPPPAAGPPPRQRAGKPGGRARRKDEAEPDIGPGGFGMGGVPGLPPQAVEALLATGAGTLVARLLNVWKPRHAPGLGGMLRAGLAGAGASLARRVVRSFLEDRAAPGIDEEMAQALAAGAARGLLYAAIVEPRLVGPAPLRGAVFGALEYAVSPWGGLTSLLGSHAPHRKLPLLDGLFEGYDPTDDTLGDHIAFAVALAVLYGVGDDPAEGDG